MRCHEVRDFLARNGVPFLWLDPDDENAAPQIAAHHRAARPASAGDLARRFTLAAFDSRALADFVGLHTTPTQASYDVVIVGGGPAGLAASVYGASEGLASLLIERTAPGGQAGTSSRIENYFGFPSGLSGDDLSSRARQQAQRFGAGIVVARAAAVPDSCRGRSRNAFRLLLDDGAEIAARAVVLAMGVEWRRLGVPGVERFTGRGVFYGAARTEALSMRGKNVHIIGGGNSAGQAAVMFSDYADQVTLLVRGSSLADSMSSYLSQQLDAKANIAVELNTEVIACAGRADTARHHLAQGDRTHEREVESDGLFVFIGATADTVWLDGHVQRDGSDSCALELPFTTNGGRWNATRRCWRRAFRGFSPQVTCAPARSSVLPPASEKAAWPSPSSTNTWVPRPSMAARRKRLKPLLAARVAEKTM